MVWDSGYPEEYHPASTVLFWPAVLASSSPGFCEPALAALTGASGQDEPCYLWLGETPAGDKEGLY